MQFKQMILTTTNRFKLLSLYSHTSDHELQLAGLFSSPTVTNYGGMALQ